MKKREEPSVKNLKEATNEPEKTRSQISLVFILGFLIIIAGTLMLGILIKDYSINDMKDLLLVISSILSSPLGFIIGYYFKSRSETL